MNWSINLENLSHGGFAPLWFRETYPSYGNKNQAGNMVNIDMTNPGYIQQGPGLANLTNGTEGGEVTTLIKGIDNEANAGFAYAVGGNQLYKLSSTTVVSDANFAHTIDKAAVTDEAGEDVAFYQGNIYYTYGHSGGAGDIGLLQLDSTFDDDFGSTIPSGAGALTGNTGGLTPYQMVMGNDILYISNRRYVATLNASALTLQALDFPAFHVISSIQWNQDRLWIGVNIDYAASATRPRGAIYTWDGTTDSWETEIKVDGTVGGLYTKNGIVFFFYRDASSTTEYRLAYVKGNTYEDLATFEGSLPNYAQVSEYKGFLIWSSSGLIYAFGSGDPNMPLRFFQLADGGYTTVGGIATPFGTPFISSTQSTSFKLAQFSGFDVTSSLKSLMFDITGFGKVSKIDHVRFNFEALASGARVNWKLLNNKGVTMYSDIISFSKLGAATTAYYSLNGMNAENFRVELDYANGDTTNTVKVKSVRINGTAN